MKKAIGFLLMTFVTATALAAPILHTTTNKVIEWWKPTDSGQIEAYVSESGDYVYKVLPAAEFSRFETGSIQNVKAGKMVLFEIQGELRACKVSHLFQNGKTFAFCDFIGMTKIGERVVRAQIEGQASQFIGEDLSASSSALLKADYKGIKAGTRVLVRASFVNGMALIQRDSLENRLIQSPLTHAGSMLVPTDLLK